MKKWLIVLIAILVSACARNYSSERRFVDYAQTIPPITVPAGIKDPTGESYYPVPAGASLPVVVPPLAPPPIIAGGVNDQ